MAKNDNVGIRVGILHASATKSIKQLDKETKNYGKTLKEVFNKSKLIGFITLIKDVTDTMIMASKPQTEYIENLNLMNTAYGSLNNSGGELIKQLNDIFGLDPSNLTKSLGTFRQLSSALNLTNDIAETLSENLLKMQLDVASLYNLDLDTASKKLISAITGESRAVKVLGADLTQAGLQQTAYNMGISKSVKTMTQAEKTILRYITLQNQLKNSQGDFAKTINSVSNQTKIFKEQTSMLIRQLGGLFIPILKTILPLLNGILMAINTIIGALMSLMGIDAENLAKEFGVGAGAIDNITNSLDSVNEASENAKKSLRGFDKLNVISTPSDNSSGFGGGVSQEMLDAIKEYDMMMSSINSKATQIRDKILEWLGFSKDNNGEWKLTDVTFGNILTTATIIYNVFKLIKDLKIFDFLDKVKIFKDIGEYIGVWKQGGATFKELIVAIFKTVGKALIPFVGIVTIVGGIFEIFKGIEELKLGEKFNGWMDIIIGIAAVVAGVAVLFAAWPVALIAGIILVAGIITKFIVNNWEEITTKIKELWKKFTDWLQKDTGISKAVKAIVNVFIGAINGVINSINSFLSPFALILKAIQKIVGKDFGSWSNLKIPKIKYFENGGFPEKGQLFIANEKSPEMIGNINGRPAVANNDQIVQAISVGVAKAMLSVGNNSNVNVTIEANGDTSGLLNFIEFKQKQRNRQYGL